MALLTHKFPTLVGILVLLTGVGFGIWYVNSKQVDLSGESQPAGVRITNVADSKFSVSWTTSVVTKGTVVYGKLGEKPTTEVKDDRDILGEEAGNYITHHVTISGLQPATPYTFRIKSGSGDTLYDNNGAPYSVTTGPTIAATPPAETIYGQAEQGSTLPAEGAIVYLNLPGAAPASTIVNTAGNYTIPTSVLRSNDLKTYVKYDPEATIMEIEIVSGKQVATAKVSTANADPVPLITLGKNHDFTTTMIAEDKQEPVVAQVEPTTPDLSPTPAPVTPGVFNVEPLANQTTSANVTITNPSEEGEKLATQNPEFAGKGPKGTVLSVVVASTKKTYKDTVSVGNLGTWTYAPSVALEDGSYTITVAYVDSAGKEQKIKKTFAIDSKLAAVAPAFVATPSASLSPSPKPSATPSPSIVPSPSIRAAIPATDSGVPVTGVIENTVLTVVFAAVIMVGGALLFAL